MQNVDFCSSHSSFQDVGLLPACTSFTQLPPGSVGVEQEGAAKQF